jgi:hypothetical protein
MKISSCAHRCYLWNVGSGAAGTVARDPRAASDRRGRPCRPGAFLPGRRLSGMGHARMAATPGRDRPAASYKTRADPETRPPPTRPDGPGTERMPIDFHRTRFTSISPGTGRRLISRAASVDINTADPPSRRATFVTGVTLMQAPKIQTAIPQRRYQLGGYSGVVLGEIESGDDVKYRYILALVREGEAKPGFYVTAEKNPRRRAHEGSHRLRVITQGLDEEIESSDRWEDLDAFCEAALELAGKVLGLSNEEPVQLA